jgi:hypothetical protein
MAKPIAMNSAVSTESKSIVRKKFMRGLPLVCVLVLHSVRSLSNSRFAALRKRKAGIRPVSGTNACLLFWRYPAGAQDRCGASRRRVCKRMESRRD